MNRIEQKYAAKRLEILRSAVAAFSRQGFDSVTMEEIAQALDMTKGNLYYYFESKQEILYFCLKFSLDQLLQEARLVVEGCDPHPVKLYGLIVSQIRFIQDVLKGSAAHIDFRGLPKSQIKIVLSKRDEYESLLREVVRRGIEAREFHARDPRIAVWAILGAVNWTARWFSEEGELTAEQIAHEFARLLVGGLVDPDRLERMLSSSRESPLGAAQVGAQSHRRRAEGVD